MDQKKLYNYLKDNPEEIDRVIEETAQEIGGRKYQSKSKEARIQQYRRSKELRAKMLENRVPFIAPDFDEDFFLCQGMTLVAAMSGKSKSTTCANILAGFYQHCPGKQVIVVTNEEASDAIIDRVACILLKQNYVDLYKGRLSAQTKRKIEEMSTELSSSIEVVDDPSWDMSCLEDVKAVLEHAAKSVHMVVIDYLQTITHSREFPQMESYRVLKELGLYLKDYGRRVGVPVVVFAQLKTQGENSSLADRIQNDKTIYNHAFNVIEVIPDFKTLLTKFIIHKGRFELKQMKEITMVFKHGRYEKDGVDL